MIVEGKTSHENNIANAISLIEFKASVLKIRTIVPKDLQHLTAVARFLYMVSYAHY